MPVYDVLPLTRYNIGGTDHGTARLLGPFIVMNFTAIFVSFWLLSGKLEGTDPSESTPRTRVLWYSYSGDRPFGRGDLARDNFETILRQI